MIEISFDNLEELKRVYDPKIITKATESTTRRLRDRVATQVSRAIRKRYAVRASEINAALVRRTRYRGGSEALLIYTSGRLSLSRFATGRGGPTRSNRPKVKTRRGIRYGAKVRVVKSRPAKRLQGAVFWGRGRRGFNATNPDRGLGEGAWQIWKREGLSRDGIRRLTGPGVSQMVRSKNVTDAVETYVQDQADRILLDRINFYTGRSAGVL